MDDWEVESDLAPDEISGPLLERDGDCPPASAEPVPASDGVDLTAPVEDRSTAPPAPVEDPPAERSAPVPAPRVARGGRIEHRWGPFTISQVMRSDEHIGWGANCNRHSDPGCTLACTKCITLGKRNALTDEQCVAKLKYWLLKGYEIDTELTAYKRKAHVCDVDARKLPVLPDDVLDSMLGDRRFAP